MAAKKVKSATAYDDNDNPTKSSDDDASLQTQIPIMDEILPRLPVKSLIRFKLVSKSWNSTISSPKFAKLHLKFRSCNSKNRHFIMFPHDDKFFVDKKWGDYYYCLPYRERSNVKDLVELRGGVGDVHWHHLVGSCNGLVCLYQRNDFEHEKGCFFTLWNPATREDTDIASPNGVHVSEAHGFGYVPSLDDYFIVASFGSGTNDYSKFRGFYVFSLRTGEWTRILGSFEYKQMSRWCWKWKKVRATSNEESIAKGLDGEKGVVVGNVMYWADYWPGNEIVEFDLVSMDLKQKPKLDWQSDYDSLQLFQVKGCLALLGRRRNEVSDLWMLKNVDDWSSWQKFVSVDLTNISLITLSETGKCLVRQFEDFKLVDLCKEALECTRGCDTNFARMVETRDHVESLVSPFGITQTCEDDEALVETRGHVQTLISPFGRNHTNKDVYDDEEEEVDDDDDDDEDDDVGDYDDYDDDDVGDYDDDDDDDDDDGDDEDDDDDGDDEDDDDDDDDNDDDDDDDDNDDDDDE